MIIRFLDRLLRRRRGLTARIFTWFQHRWVGVDENLLKDYLVTFSGLQGQRVLQHLMDSVYCTVYEGSNRDEALIHNARRTVIQEILENLDRAEHPQKYEVKVETATMEAPNAVAR